MSSIAGGDMGKAIDIEKLRLTDPLLVEADWDAVDDVAHKVAEAQLAKALWGVYDQLNAAHGCRNAASELYIGILKAGIPVLKEKE
jgi:hypothetical protein